MYRPRAARSLLVVGTLLLGPGCSSKTTTTGGSGGSSGAAGAGGASVCGVTCDAIDSAGCPNESKQDCLDVCGKALNDCTTLAKAFASCVETAQVSCSSSGTAVFAGCEQQAFALLPCQVCVLRSSDTAHEKCLKQTCCAELKGAYSESSAKAYTDCLSACAGSDTCQTGCGNQFPAAAKAFNTLGTCTNQCPSGAG